MRDPERACDIDHGCWPRSPPSPPTYLTRARAPTGGPPGSPPCSPGETDNDEARMWEAMWEARLAAEAMREAGAVWERARREAEDGARWVEEAGATLRGRCGGVHGEEVSRREGSSGGHSGVW